MGKSRLPILIKSDCGEQNYEDFGILIPLKHSRVQQVLESLSFEQFEIIDCTECEDIREKDLALAHDDEFLSKLGQDPIGLVATAYELINSDGSYNRYNPDQAKYPLDLFVSKGLSHVNGTYRACKEALEHDFAYHLGGGMHHAMSFAPGGFCLFNDIVISLKKLIGDKAVASVAVIDMDAHKGDGTAQITRGDASIKTYSIHMKNGWPLDGEEVDSVGRLNPSFIPSDCDVPISPEDDYLAKFKDSVASFCNQSFDLVLVVHGADVYEKDELESAKLIQLSKQEVLARDKFIYELLRDKKMPQAWVMAGGYGKESYKIFAQFLNFIANND
jgi:acetoin utilization deacetylase AcuC-like enzyme